MNCEQCGLSSWHDKKRCWLFALVSKLLPKDYHKDMRGRGDFSCMHREIIENACDFTVSGLCFRFCFYLEQSF